jgi:hypothetical protein
MGKVTPRMRDSRVIKLIFNPFKGVKLNFLDSYSILPAKLSKLCDSFNVEVKKGKFPHEFASFNNLNYIGPHPITAEPDWNFHESLLHYLYLDCYSLWNILDKFVASIFLTYRVNVLKFSSLPSIAFAIFRTQYLPSNTIVSLYGRVDFYIRQSYFGGIVDVYHSTGSYLYYYDINSLYPHSMCLDMPIGNPIFYDSNISLNDSSIFGFY